MIKFVKNEPVLSLIILIVLLICSFLLIESANQPPASPAPEEAVASWSPHADALVIECYLEGPTEEFGEGEGEHFATSAADICIVDPEGENLIRLTKESGEDRFPVWSPDGTEIAYTRSDGIYVMNADGSRQRRLVDTPQAGYAENVGKVTWSPNGSHLLFSACLSENPERDVYTVAVASGVVRNLTGNNGSQDFNPLWSLAGTKIVFWSINAPLPDTGVCHVDPSSTSPSLLKVMSNDGSKESTLYTKKFKEILFSTTDDGQVAFIDNRTLHLIDLETKVSIMKGRVSGEMIWSPDERYLAYENFDEIDILDVKTNDIRKIPIPGLESIDSWSLDSQQIAVTVGEPGGFAYDEQHIYIVNLRRGSVHRLFEK